MKDSLIKHIASIFATLGIKSPYVVYDCLWDTLPDWAENIRITHEYLICCDDTAVQNKLQSFLQKKIVQVESRLYWFEGNEIELKICNSEEEFFEKHDGERICKNCMNKECCIKLRRVVSSLRSRGIEIEVIRCGHAFVGRAIIYNGIFVEHFGLNKNETTLILIMEDLVDIHPITNSVENRVVNNSEVNCKTVDYLKTDTRIPAWLDDYIFNHLQAEYAPDYKRYEYNLDLTEDENLKYLGTYFPRSYAESFCIFDNVFQNKAYQQVISKKTTLNILSIGCGTGGDIIGLLTVIEKYCSHINKINVWAIDGNKDALSLLVKILDKYKAKTTITIELQTITTVFDNLSNVKVSKAGIPNVDYDFILCFKMICEIIAIGRENAYCDFVKKFVPMLSESGLCLLLDVTVQSKDGTFLPILMNRQVNQALRELKGYQTLLPLSCGQFENICMEQCFTQQHFRYNGQK